MERCRKSVLPCELGRGLKSKCPGACADASAEVLGTLVRVTITTPLCFARQNGHHPVAAAFVDRR
jgi:hypothetical protein